MKTEDHAVPLCSLWGGVLRGMSPLLTTRRFFRETVFWCCFQTEWRKKRMLWSPHWSRWETGATQGLRACGLCSCHHCHIEGFCDPNNRPGEVVLSASHYREHRYEFWSWDTQTRVQGWDSLWNWVMAQDVQGSMWSPAAQNRTSTQTLMTAKIKQSETVYIHDN